MASLLVVGLPLLRRPWTVRQLLWLDISARILLQIRPDRMIIDVSRGDTNIVATRRLILHQPGHERQHDPDNQIQ